MSDTTCGFCEIHDCWHGAPGEEAWGELREILGVPPDACGVDVRAAVRRLRGVQAESHEVQSLRRLARSVLREVGAFEAALPGGEG